MKCFFLILSLFSAIPTVGDTCHVQNVSMLKTVAYGHNTFIKLELPTGPSALPVGDCGDGWVQIPNVSAYLSVLSARSQMADIKDIVVVVDTAWITVRPAFGSNLEIRTRCKAISIEVE